MGKNDELLTALRENVREKESLIRKYEDDLHAKNTMIEWIIHTLKSTVQVLESLFKK